MAGNLKEFSERDVIGFAVKTKDGELLAAYTELHYGEFDVSKLTPESQLDLYWGGVLREVLEPLLLKYVRDNMRDTSRVNFVAHTLRTLSEGGSSQTRDLLDHLATSVESLYPIDPADHEKLKDFNNRLSDLTPEEVKEAYELGAPLAARKAMIKAIEEARKILPRASNDNPTAACDAEIDDAYRAQKPAKGRLRMETFFNDPRNRSLFDRCHISTIEDCDNARDRHRQRARKKRKT